jgi:PAS domain S-box-containing protein
MPRPRPQGDPLPPALLGLMFDSTSDGMVAMDRDRRVIAFNRAAERTLGRDRGDVLGRPCREVLRSDLCDDCCAVACHLAAGQEVVNMPVELIDARGRRVPTALSSSVLHDRDGTVLGAVTTFRNLRWVKDLIRAVDPQHPFADIVSDDPHMNHVFEVLPSIADSESSVLVHGETGAGKNLVARAIHNLSPRREQPFITINCGALPETLLESELFGYRAGAFTGASRDRMGRIAVAEGGTVFLDEIGDMSPGMQVKLLRFLQDRVYERLGDNTPIKADVRVVAATHHSLAALVEAGRFRRDLYYRINVLSIEIPPLRERPRDVPLLAQRFLERLALRRGRPLPDLSQETLALLTRHTFPGNVRELENIIEHAFVLCRGPVIEPQHLPETLGGPAERAAPATARSYADLEAQFLRDALARHGWNRQATARALGIHKTTLLRRIKRLGLALPDRDGRTRRGPVEDEQGNGDNAKGRP